MKNDRMGTLIEMIEKGGNYYRKARDLMTISIKYENILTDVKTIN